ncbi:hypothetical protein Dsin_009206 [Dipteronia sinensis]|uniref:RNase H type-1 domain-containing protein n=1 Tax=Dipteronia sinensis TaxID=43782 RepID=A0AAE0AQ62_9ROSI|nr:hypothetical protein Dsin_009206 [Dipteronia sinensis]
MRGLGIGKMLIKNKSLLAKWIWRYGTEEQALWRRVIRARYGSLDTDLLWDWKCNHDASQFAKTVASLFEEGTTSNRVLTDGLKVVIGDGSKANFWDITNVDSIKLKMACPRIYALAVRKTRVVQDFGGWHDSQWEWKVALRRPLFDWEKTQGCVFRSLLDSITVTRLIPDTLAWTYRLDGKFTIGSFRLCMEDQNTDSSLDHNLVWQGCCPPKVEIFMWNVLRGRVLVCQVLRKFGIASASSTACPLCHGEEETIDHLFLSCPWSWNLWTKCMNWWEVVSCHNKTMKSWFQGWDGLCSSNKFRRAWDTLFFAISWTIWEARNHTIFRSGAVSVPQAVDTVKFRVVWWYKYHGVGSKLQISTMLLNIKESCTDSKPMKRRDANVWIPPIGLGLKFNVDGSAKGNPGSAGIGGVLRDNLGKVLGLFSENVGVLDSISTELLAIHRAVSLCADITSLIVKEIDIISDSKVAVSWINSEGLGSLKHIKLIYEIRSLLNNLHNARVLFNSRASNSFADSLAKKGSAMEKDCLIWEVH